MNQTEMIYEYLLAGHSLTPLEALSKFGCLTLSQRCGDLRRDGVPIESEMVKLDNGKRVARYTMGKIAHG